LDELPLGSGALAGLAFDLDRKYTASLLGFARISSNSMDGVSSRDSLLSVMSDIAIMFVNLSRLSEDLILWSSDEFQFLEIADDYATGSSIMPHKKNADMLELTRGRAGKIFGNLTNLLTTMKGLPLAYNRDMQEDKEPLFSSVDLAIKTLNLLAKMLPKCKVNKVGANKASQDNLLYATDLMDYVVKKGVALKDAHSLVGQIVLYSIENKKDLAHLSLEEIQKFSKKIEVDFTKIFSSKRSLSERQTIGSTNLGKVKVALAKWQKKLK